MNKKSSRYRRLQEIKSRNSLRLYGLNPKDPFTITTIYGEKTFTYKDQIFIEGINCIGLPRKA